MSTPVAEAPRSGSQRSGSAWVGLGITVAVVALATLLPRITGWNVHVHTFPPLHSDWDPRTGSGTVPAVLIGLLGIRYAADLAGTLPWRRLLALVFATGLAWMVALAYVDGREGIGTILGTDNEYLPTARATTDLPHTLATYTERIPYDAPLGNWPEHLAGHPPGALTFFVALVRLGLGGAYAAGMVVTVIAATTAVAVLVTVRILGAEDLARRAAPFLTLGPAAIWACVSGDGMFAAVAAWGMAALAMAATRRSTRAMLGWSVAAGLLLGSCVMLSYGLPLLGLVAITILYLTGSWRPLVPAALAALAVVLTYFAFGFAWWEAIGVLRERYWDGVAHERPTRYYLWANFASLAFSAGPLVGAGLAHAFRTARGGAHDAGTRVLLWLAGAGAAMVLVADVSLMSKAEVERIWLPFVPWLLLSCALLPERWRRWGLALQIVSALVVQHLTHSIW